MREIKFRGWFVTQKKMYSSYEFMNMAGFVDFLKNPTVVPMQFIGQHDKNKKEIYQSDFWKLGDVVYLIVWHEGDMQTGWKKKGGDYLTDIGKDNANKGEVVGNMYEPELLKETK